jgi:5-oxoprolinase (ATP-hydrolysing)
MGGTSTDVSRFGGHFEHVFETTTGTHYFYSFFNNFISIAGITIQAPQLDISTVAAGGGSRLFFENNMFLVGPESASAHPGPVRTSIKTYPSIGLLSKRRAVGYN